MAHSRPAIIFSVVALFLGALVGPPTPRPAVAQDASSLTLSLTSNVTRAKIGDILEFTVRIENTGDETISGLNVGIGLPDALDARVVYCPFGTADSVIDCKIDAFAPDSIGDVVFYVHVGSRTANGWITAYAHDGENNLLASDLIDAIKIIGSPKIR